jgi:hypothetical protein
MLLAILPVFVHLPALSGWFRIDPIYVVSGVTPGTWTTNGLVPGFPWIDGNAGVTTEALGGLVAHDWLSLKLPWWNPYSGVGLPLAAEGQNPAFFLPFVLLLALPHGLLLLRMCLMALAGFFTFALLRRMRLNTVPSLAGAVLFELNGTFALLAHGPIMPVAFLPLILLGLEQATIGFSLSCVLGVAWSFTAGFPETACLNLVLAGIWAAIRCAQAPDRLRYALRAGGSAACGMLLASPAVWPFLEALPREFVGTHAGIVASGLLPANTALLLFPGIFGAPLAGTLSLGQPDAVWVRAGGTCDIVLLVLATCALRWRVQDRALRFAMAGWLVLSFARAVKWPAAVFLFGVVPFLREANVHLYVLPGWSMALAILAAMAVQDWQAGAVCRPWRLLLPAAALTAIAGYLALPAMQILWVALPGYKPFVAAALLTPLLCLLALAAIMRGKATPPRAPVLAICVTLNAALLFILPELAGTHKRVVDAGAVRFLQDHAGLGPVRFLHDHAGLGPVRFLHDDAGLGPVRFLHDDAGLGRVLSLGPLVPNYGAYYGVAEIGHNYLPVPSSWVEYARARLMPDMDGVNFYAGAPPTRTALMAALPAYEAAGVDLVTVLPGVQPFDMSRVPAPTLAYRGTAMDIWQIPNAAPYFQAPGCKLAVASRTQLQTNCGAPSSLHRLELFWPGWQADIDGHAVAIASDGGIFQSVPLPAGESHVVFSYSPPGNRVMWVAWTVGLLGLAMIAAFSCTPKISGAKRTI